MWGRICFNPDYTRIEIDVSDVIEVKVKGILVFESLIDAYFKSKELLAQRIRESPKEIYWKDIG